MVAGNPPPPNEGRNRLTTSVETIDTQAPDASWRRVFGDWAVVGSSTVVCHGLGVVTSLLLKMLLSPARMGVWQAVKVFISYGNYANLGISKGAIREFTVACGAGETASARRGLDLAFSVNTVSSLAYAAVLVAAGVWIGRTTSGPWAGAWALGLAVGGALAVLGRYVTFRVTILRARQEFGLTSRLAVLEAVLTLAIAGTAAWLWGLAGLYLGTLAVLTASLVFVQRHSATRLRWAWDGAEVRRLVVVGGPILLAGTVSSLFRSLDKLMILGYLSDREFQLGCYSVGLMVSSQLFGLGNMLAMVMGPRYGRKFGRSGNRREVARLAARATEFQAAAIGLPAALAVIAGPPLLAWLLPAYETGLAPLVWLVPGAVAMTLALPASQYLVAVDRQRRALAVVAVATALAAVGNHFVLSGGHGLVGLAGMTTAAYTLYFLLIVRTSLWIELDPAQRLRYAGMLLLALGPTLAVALALEILRPGVQADWTTWLGRSGLIVALWLAVIAIGWRWAGWRELLHGERL